MEIALSIVLLVMSVALVALVLFQSGKDKKLSGTIAGGAETFFGKTKASDYNKTLSLVTTIVAIVFTVVVVAAYIIL